MNGSGWDWWKKDSPLNMLLGNGSEGFFVRMTWIRGFVKRVSMGGNPVVGEPSGLYISIEFY